MYSPAKDGVYCMACVLFGDTTVDKNCSKLERLVNTPITFWTTACSKLKKYEEKSQLHKSSMAKMENFLKVMAMEQSSVAEYMNSSTAAQINANRQKLESIIKTIVLCGHQNIAL